MNAGKIDVSFFQKFCAGRWENAHKRWQVFARGRAQTQHRYIRALALCAGVHDSTVKKWLSSDVEDYKHVKETHKVIFRKATTYLDRDLPRPEYEDMVTGGVPKKSGPTRIAVFTSLSVFSESYHWAVVRSIVRGATAHGLVPSIHELEWTHPISGEQARNAGLIVSRYAPEAVVIVRLTPTQEFLHEMNYGGRLVPVVLIHADRQQYPPPVLANVVPSHQSISRELKGWLRARRHMWGVESPKVVLVAMPEEVEEPVFPRSPGIPFCIRNDRIAAIEHALEGFQVFRCQVPDYSFRHALKIWESYPEADAYVCLSDALALGLTHLLRCRGCTEEECRERIVGFDGTLFAQESRIVSISQGLEEIGSGALDTLCTFLDKNEGQEARFPSMATEVSHPVRLVNTE